MRAQSRLTIIILVLVAEVCATRVARCQDYAVGADVSFLAQAEQQGVVFKDNGTAKPCLEILKDHGYNWIRLRLFHTPKELPNNLDYTIARERRHERAPALRTRSSAAPPETASRVPAPLRALAC
jgi:arabinogalactan endo-1,4-beta-galactosidase